jgi:peptidyl-tRNA hydrolase, PTH1 family
MSLLIVGLGNPGPQYKDTRHNIGFQVVEKLASEQSTFWKEKFKGEYASIKLAGENHYLLKPLTYMNLSGESVVACAQFFKVALEDILIIHDELDLPFGTITYKNGGGLAGHNGLKSIAELSGSKDFKRLRCGIGRPESGTVSNFVLSPFSSDENPLVEDFINLANDSLVFYTKNGYQKTSNKYNKKTIC